MGIRGRSRLLTAFLRALKNHLIGLCTLRRIEMVEYPLSLPTDALMTLLDVVRGKVDTSKAVHAAWNILGYGLAQGFPIQQGIGDSSDAATAEALEVLIAHDHPEAVGFPALALGIVLRLALKIIMESLT
jgi:hypothetical protein